MKRWLIPVFFLFLAILACDAPYYDPVHVVGVKADTTMSGRVYAVVGNEDTQTTYRSDDYGHLWQRTTEIIKPDQPTNITLNNETLRQKQTPIWSFPRSTYRFFFLNDDDQQYFKLPTGSVSSSEANGVLYVAMGTEGVVVFPPAQQWYMSAQGIDLLHPLPLTITDGTTILAIIVLALVIPPLPLLHAYLLTRVWLYALPPRKAWHLALTVSVILTLLAAVAITLWLTDARTDYYGIVVMMSAISVFAGVGTIMLAVPADQEQRLVWRTAVVSLIVPACVASIWVGWLILLPLLGCYVMFRALYVHELAGWQDVTKGLIDHLTIRSMAVVIICSALVLIAGGMLGVVFKFADGFTLLGLLIGAVWSVTMNSRYYAAKYTPYGAIGSIHVSVSVVTVLCYPVAGGLALLIFFAQSSVYSWFTKLLIAAR